MATASTNATKTKNDAARTARNAKATARSASNKASAQTRSATRTTRRETRATQAGVRKHSRRVVTAAQREVEAVAATPYRPALFALGVVDRFTAGVRSLPSTVTSTVTSTPSRLRTGVVDVAATAGDWAEQAQRGYTEIARDGEKLVRSIRRQESTQRAVKFADRAQTRGQRAVSDAEKAVEAGTEAAQEAVSKLG